MQHLTELEEKLSKPGGFALQQKMLAELEAAALRLRQQLAASVPRADFETHKKAIDAVQAAIEVLQAWPTQPEDKVRDMPFTPASARPSSSVLSLSSSDFFSHTQTFPFVNPTRSFS